MTDPGAYLADSAVGLAAALGALLVLLRIDRFTAVPGLAARFRFCLRVLVALMGVRVVYWGTGGWLWTALTFALAGLMPLCALLLAEGLLRRHAPPALKALAAGGAVAMALLALLPVPREAQAGLLLALQLAGIGGVAGFVLRRDRASLSAAENRAIGRLALSLALILPLLATDFLRDGWGDIPVRMGGLAVLALCWLAVNLHRPGLGAGAIVKGFAAACGVTLAVTLVLAHLGGLPGRGAVQAGAVLLAAVLLLAIWQAAMAFGIEDRQGAILHALAHAPDPLALIRRGAGAPDALLLGPEDLAEVDTPALRARLASHPVHAAGDPGGAAEEALAWLCTRFEATHLVCLSPDPLRLVALANPALTGSESARDALAALQRMAARMQEVPA